MTDQGIETVRYIYRIMNVDAEWSVWDERGFTWWGGGLAQRVWSEPSFEDRGVRLWRLHARTDLIRGCPDRPDLRTRLAVLSAFSTLSGWVRHPEDPGRIQSATSVFLHEQNRDWLQNLFALAVAVQAAEAHIGAPVVAESLEAEPDFTAHPGSGERTGFDDMLNVIEQLVRPVGDRPNAWIGPEMEVLSRLLNGPRCVLATGDEKGVAAEYPFGDWTSLLQIRGERNPRLGDGALFSLQLPIPYPKGDGEEEGAEIPDILDLNRRELASITAAHFLGSWCCSPQGFLAFVSFLPNLAHRPGLLSTLAQGFANRVDWVTRDVFGLDPDADLLPALARKAEALGKEGLQ